MVVELDFVFSATVSQWYTSGIPLIYRWNTSGIPAVNFGGIPLKVYHWYTSGKFQWYSTESLPLVYHWYTSGKFRWYTTESLPLVYQWYTTRVFPRPIKRRGSAVPSNKKPKLPPSLSIEPRL